MAESFFETLSRVYSFTTGSWPYLDQKQLCPYKLAEQGYFIKCHVCHNGVNVPPEFDADLYETIQNIKKHKQNCIYSCNQTEGNPEEQKSVTSKEEIYLLMDEIVSKLKQNNLLIESKKYPVLNKEEIQKYLAEDIFTFKSIDQAYKLNWDQQIKISFFLQYFGWFITKEQHHLNAECLLCGRKVSLKDKKLLDKNQQSKTQNYQEEEAFSPISEHRYFCLWVNPKCSGFKGYSIYLQYAFDKIIESKSLFPRRPVEETKKIRVEMVKYIENFQTKTSQQFERIKSIFRECQGLKNSIQEPGQGSEQRIFVETENKMTEFVDDFLQEEVKGQVKKIKLN